MMKTLTFEVNSEEWSVIVGGNGVMALFSSTPCSLWYSTYYSFPGSGHDHFQHLLHLHLEGWPG